VIFSPLWRIRYYPGSPRVAYATVAEGDHGNGPGRTHRTGSSYTITKITTGSTPIKRAGIEEVEKPFCPGRAHRQVEFHPGLTTTLVRRLEWLSYFTTSLLWCKVKLAKEVS